MVSGISEVSSLQVLRATQAFKAAIKSTLNSASGNDIEDVEVKLSLSPESQKIMSNPRNVSTDKIESVINKNYLNEVKDFVDKIGINNVSNEDLEYAMRYGRSILVDKVG